jgi:sec-independent protein translocase protein TatB
MFGIGMPEMLLILAIALIVIGPKKLPDLAKSLGRAMREFKKATNELKETMQVDDELSEVKKAFDGINEDVKNAIDVKPAAKKAAEDEAENPAKKTAPPESSPDDLQPLDKLKSAFDDFNENTATQPPDEIKLQQSSPPANDDPDKPEKRVKGPADDA